jgi:hypothetical protein
MSRNAKKPSAEEIAAIYDAIEDLDPDISTETLFSRVRDHFNGRINDGDIAAALKLSADFSD